MTDATSSIAADDRAGRLVRIGPFHDVLDANLARSRMVDEGIAVSVAGENLSTTLGPLYGAAYAGGPFVLVKTADEAAARAIIAAVERARRERTDAQSPPCPRCAHRPTTRVTHGVRWLAIGVFLASALIASRTTFGVIGLAAAIVLLVVPHKPAWKCPACRHRFAAGQPVPQDDE